MWNNLVGGIDSFLCQKTRKFNLGLTDFDVRIENQKFLWCLARLRLVLPYLLFGKLLFWLLTSEYRFSDNERKFCNSRGLRIRGTGSQIKNSFINLIYAIRSTIPENLGDFGFKVAEIRVLCGHYRITWNLRISASGSKIKISLGNSLDF